AAFVVAMAGNHTLWAFDGEQGSMTHLAGTMNEGLEDGPGESAWFAQPSGLAVATDGAIWVADAETSALRRVTPVSGAAVEVRTAVGQGLFDFGHRDGPAEQALMQHPLGVATLPDGSVVVADTYDGALRRFVPADGDAGSVGDDTSGTRIAGEVTTLATGLAEPSGVVVQVGEGPDGEPQVHLLVVESAAHRLTRVPRRSWRRSSTPARTARGGPSRRSGPGRCGTTSRSSRRRARSLTTGSARRRSCA